MRNKRILFFVILFIAICLRLFQLDKGYNSDEGWLLKRAYLGLSELIPSLSKGTSTYPLLSPLLLHFWIKLSNAEIWIRAYFVIFGIALCILIYYLGKLYVNPQFGLIALSLSAISPLLIWASQFIRSYIDSAFWSILSIYFMLRILKGLDFLKNALGYVIASILAIYTSYAFGLLLLAQNAFVFIFYVRHLQFIKKWSILQIIIAAISIPCLLLILRQTGLATGIHPVWGERGFQLFGFRIGDYARSIVGILGMDSGFLTGLSLIHRFKMLILMILAGASFCIIAYLIFAALKNLKNIVEDKRLIWFFPFISITASIPYCLMAEFLHFPIHYKYFIIQTVLFIFVISSAVYYLVKKEKLSIFIFVVFLIIYSSRFPEAVKPEFDTKKAYNYLIENMEPFDCLLMVRNTNYYINTDLINAVVLYKFTHTDYEQFYNSTLSARAKGVLFDIKKQYSRLWFYRSYSNDEILGMNTLLMNWLKANGYTIENTKKFRRIEIILYKISD